MIRLERVSFSYAGAERTALRDLTLTIGNGECVVLCGRSGCGKTTATRLLNGLIPHYFEGTYTGSVTVAGMEIRENAMHRIATVVGSVFQNPRSQFFNVDTDSEIVFGLENQSLPRDELLSALERTTSELSLQELRNRSIFQLSGGEKQKVAFASVYSMGPELYVLDEPSSNLDAAAIDYLREVLTLLKGHGKTIVIAEHRLSYLHGIADRYLHFESGSLSRTMTPGELESLSSEKRRERGLRTITLSDVQFKAPTVNNAPPVLTVERVRLFAGKREIATGIGLTARPGDVVGVVGLNGTGKSTFVRSLCGLHKGVKGSFRWKGKEVGARQRRSISYLVFQDVNYQLFADSVREESHFGIRNPDMAFVDKTLRDLNLDDLHDRHPATLSGGQKQRTAIAVSLNSRRELLVFDEPTSGLDYESMLQVAGTIRRLADAGNVIFVVTHDYELLAEISNTIMWFANRTARVFGTESAEFDEVRAFFTTTPVQGR